MRIGELAARTGVPTKTIRFYEQIGVLPEPERAPNGYRVYGPDDADRLGFVRDAQATGLSLEEIAMILRLRGMGESTCEHVLELLEHHLADLDGLIDTLQATRTELAAMTERARSLDPAECTDPNRCQTIEGTSGRKRTDLTAELHAAPRRPRHRH